MGERPQGLAGSHERTLLGVLSDDVLLPLVQVKTALELIAENPETAKDNGYFEQLFLSTEAGIRLVEAYRMLLGNQPLPLEPTAIGPVLEEIAHQLQTYASSYKTELIVDLPGSLKPVLAHRPSFFAAMQCLGTSLIRSSDAVETGSPRRLLLAAHGSVNSKTVVGVFGGFNEAGRYAWRSARRLQGRARQPLPNVPAAATGGLLVADLLCTAMRRPLQMARHNKLNGLAALMPISRQLHLV